MARNLKQCNNQYKCISLITVCFVCFRDNLHDVEYRSRLDVCFCLGFFCCCCFFVFFVVVFFVFFFFLFVCFFLLLLLFLFFFFFFRRCVYMIIVARLYEVQGKLL